MVKVSNILIVILGILTLYIIIKNIYNMFNNHNNYKNIILNFKTEFIYKIKTFSFINKIIYALIDSDIYYKYNSINSIMIILILILSLSCFVIIYLITFSMLHLFFSSVILSIFALFLPYYIIKYFAYYKKSKILKLLPNYIISLKNYTDVNNDIILALKRTNVDEPLNSYIERFNISIEKGINVYDAFETLKQSINIKKINNFISLLQFCHIYGGDFGELLDKFSKIQMKTNIQREKEKQNIFSSKLVLIFLIILNIYIMVGFVLPNNDLYSIITSTFIGRAIININIMSYIIIFVMYIKLNKMGE